MALEILKKRCHWKWSTSFFFPSEVVVVVVVVAYLTFPCSFFGLSFSLFRKYPLLLSSSWRSCLQFFQFCFCICFFALQCLSVSCVVFFHCWFLLYIVCFLILISLLHLIIIFCFLSSFMQLNCASQHYGLFHPNFTMFHTVWRTETYLQLQQRLKVAVGILDPKSQRGGGFELLYEKTCCIECRHRW